MRELRRRLYIAVGILLFLLSYVWMVNFYYPAPQMRPQEPASNPSIIGVKTPDQKKAAKPCPDGKSCA